MAHPTKMKLRSSNGGTEVLVLVSHPMETGQRTDAKTRQRIPAHFIQTMTIEVNGKPAAEAYLGPRVAQNPLIGLVLPDAKAGDTVTVRWTDNQGHSGGAKAVMA